MGYVKEVVYTGRGSIYVLLANFIQHYTDILNNVPNKYKESVYIEQESEDDYGSLTIITTVYYYRPMTEAESREAKNQELDAKNYRRELYEKLKKEFEE